MQLAYVPLFFVGGAWFFVVVAGVRFLDLMLLTLILICNRLIGLCYLKLVIV